MSKLEHLTVALCVVVLLFIAREALAHNAGSSCPTTITTPKTNPTVSCPTGNCWGPNTSCQALTVAPTTARGWGWNPTLRKWVATGAVYLDAETETCICVENYDPEEEPVIVGQDCCHVGVHEDGTGAKVVVVFGACGHSPCPPGTCVVTQDVANPNAPDNDVVADCD